MKDEQSEIFLNGTVYDFSFDHSSVEKEHIKNCLLGFIKKCILNY